MSNLFDGKVVIVTGAGGSIGRAAALGFAAEGGRVTVADINADAAAETVELIRKAGGQAMMCAGDLSLAKDVSSLVDATIKQFGQLDCAFNNAGITHPEDGEWNETVFRKIIDVNLTSQMLCIKYEIPHMLARGCGSIVNMSSTMGIISQGDPAVTGYSTSKHAIIGLTRSAALQYAKHNIRVNALCPGVTRTPMLDAVAASSEVMRERLKNYAPLRGIAEPEEIAEAAIWLCSDKSSFVTGHALVADGGFTIQ